MRVLGINAVFHDPAAAVVVDGTVTAAAEEERFSRRKHGKQPVPFSTWELPEQAAAWCLRHSRLGPDDLDAVAYSYEPALAPPVGSSVEELAGDGWEGLRTLYARRAPSFLRTAYRGSVLAEVGGFDERFPRAYREDADLGLRVTGAGYRIVSGRRSVTHPVRPADRFASFRLQAGNADDALMRVLHGPNWRERAGIPAGRRPRHILTTAAGTVGLLGFLTGHRKIGFSGLAGWLAGTAELAWARIAPGPRTREEVTTMLLTSALLPAVATGHWLAGFLRCRSLLADDSRAPRPKAAYRPAPTGSYNSHGRPEAVLLDRDGTLVVDVPYNGDPARVAPMPGAREALDRLRAAAVPLGVISNQSGVARGLLTPGQVEAVNERVEELLGPLEVWAYCPHGPDDGCGCRKPAPGLVYKAAAELDVDPARCAVVGDIGSDIEAARAAGGRGILVPTERTLPEEIEAAPEVAPNLGAAVDLLLGEEE